MTSERANAYGRVMKTVEELGSAKLLAPETERIRTAADALFFCEDVGEDKVAQEAIADITDLRRHLVESDRWLEETAERLLADVLACGPLEPVH